METGDLNPAFLPSGARVGPWRVVEPLGRGTYGAVYRATGVEPHAPGPVALKLALHPRDERFAREAELLSRLHHPAVPRLRDSGEWRAPAGTPYPYLAMQLVEGVPLYDWARQHAPTSRQVLGLLASLARALEAIHAAGGVHRDVKGGNVLVRASDTQPFLIDFGAGHFVGASTLTWQVMPPGTPAYRSPEAGRFMRLASTTSPPYSASPADDVFALGVTAYRLITGQYPPSTDPTYEEFRLWDLENGPGARPARELNPRCDLELSDLVSWMLAVRSEARGSARGLAEALEGAARETGPEADEPLFAGDAPRPVHVSVPRPHLAPRAQERAWSPWLIAVSLGGALALAFFTWVLSAPPEEESSEEPAAMQVDERDAGTVAVGDSALTAPVAPARAPSAWTTIALEVPPKPFPGQRRPDANGRCPGNPNVPINGGCWIKLPLDPKDCEKEGAYAYKGGCYIPVLAPPRPPTSSPAELPDGGP